MRTRRFGLALAGLVFAVTAAAAQGKNREVWVPLGMATVTDRGDHDIMPVTAERGGFRQLKIEVQRASVDFQRVVVRYGNGADQTIELRNTIPAGGESRAIDLDGGERLIRSVEFWYDANTRRGRMAVVRLFGKR